MSEWTKTYEEKIITGFFDNYMKGTGLDIGYRGGEGTFKPILNSIGIDTDYPGYDGLHLPFHDLSQDYVYSSHTLEHIEPWTETIREWFRVIKPNGYMITVVPHADLYEKKEMLPSRFNPDHKRFYTPASLLYEFEWSLKRNSFRVRHLQDNDGGHDYGQQASEHSKGCYEIELVIQKIN